MNGSIISPLILKDLRLNRRLIFLSLAVGVVALVLTQLPNETTRLFGTVWFFVSLIVLACMLPNSAIVNERKQQNLPFIMSLPVSPVQYSIAKIASVWAMFLLPWLTLMISAVILIETRRLIPHGVIPMFTILAMLPLIGFCLVSSTALIGESEGAFLGATLVCNSSYWFVWYLLTRIPSLTAHWTGPAAIWSPAALLVVSAELGFIALTLVLTLFIQSGKRSFI